MKEKEGGVSALCATKGIHLWESLTGIFRNGRCRGLYEGGEEAAVGGQLKNTTRLCIVTQGGEGGTGGWRKDCISSAGISRPEYGTINQTIPPRRRCSGRLRKGGRARARSSRDKAGTPREIERGLRAQIGEKNTRDAGRRPETFHKYRGSNLQLQHSGNFPPEKNNRKGSYNRQRGLRNR